MPTLSPLQDSEAVEASRATLAKLREKLGRVSEHVPHVRLCPESAGRRGRHGPGHRSELAPKLRELAYLKVTQLTHCEVCRHYHLAMGRSAGVTEDQTRDLADFETSRAYSDVERDVLRFTAEWTGTGRVAADVMDRLLKALSPEHLVILAATVSQANFTSRFNCPDYRRGGPASRSSATGEVDTARRESEASTTTA